MADYKESTITGKTWQRAKSVEINNPLGGSPTLIFHEEAVTQTPSGTIKQSVANCTVKFNQSNPKHLELYALLDELYREAREKRDLGV